VAFYDVALDFGGVTGSEIGRYAETALDRVEI
jgi:hypothetical protein